MHAYLIAGGVALIAGLAGGVQIAVNGSFGQRIGVLEASACAGIITMVVMLSVLLVGRQGVGGIAQVSSVPPWMLIGGLMSAVLVVGVTYSAPRIGTLATMGLLIVGQLGIGVLIDSAGWFGLERIPFDYPRAAGLVLIASGAFLVLER